MVFLYPGAIHIHSVNSDGTGTVKQIADAAKKAGLEWIIITDHNNLAAKEGFYNGVCVIVGEEITPNYGNHYLALDIKTPISADMHAREYIKKVKEQGGFGFLAHPDEKKSRKNSYKYLPWKDWDIKDFGGIEIWNFFSDWADAYSDRNIFESAYAYFFRNYILSGPTKRIMGIWDKFNNETEAIIPAIGGVDAHSFNIKKAFLSLKVFSYPYSFGTITNFIHLEDEFPKDFEGQKKAILEAVKSGRNLIINRVWGGKCWDHCIVGECFESKCLNFYIKSGDIKAYSGDIIQYDESLKLFVDLPLDADVRIVHNGKVVLQKQDKNLELGNLKKGKYRLEAYYKKHPWIFSNPILVR